MIEMNQAINKNIASYLLATAFVDSKLIPTEEKIISGKKAIQDKYFSTGHNGRGFIHFTGFFNYQRIGREVNLDLERNPVLLMDSKNAAKVLVYGALKGLFTGSSILSSIRQTGKPDFIGARKAINGNLKAEEIALLAEKISA